MTAFNRRLENINLLIWSTEAITLQISLIQSEFSKLLKLPKFNGCSRGAGREFCFRRHNNEWIGPAPARNSNPACGWLAYPFNHSCVLMLLSDWWILTIHRKFREHSICVSKRRSQKCQEGRANEGPLGRSIGFNMMYSDSFRSTSDTKRELTYHTRKGSQLDSRTQCTRNSPKSSIPSIPNLHISTAVKRAPTA